MEFPGLKQENLKRLEGKDPLAAALACVIARYETSSLPPSEIAPIPAFENLANAKVKAWRKAGTARKGKEMAMGLMFRTMWGEDFALPYGECGASAPAHLSEWEPDWVSRKPTSWKMPVCMERGPCPSGVSPEPTSVERGLPPSMAAPKLGLN